MTRFVKYITVSLFVGISLLLFMPLSAADNNDAYRNTDNPFSFSVNLGLNIGAAVPWPISRLSNGTYKFSAVPKLYPAMGFTGTFTFNGNFSASVESTYKTVAIDASTWVENQRFTIDRSVPVYQYFTGTADAMMSFSMLEVPVYLRYTFNNQNHAVILGGYYSHIFKGHFESVAKKGTLTEKPLDDDYPLNQGEIVNAPISMIMDDYLDNLDVGWLVGYEHKLLNRIYLNARFMMGLHDIFKTKCLEYKMWHMRGCLTISWRLSKRS